MSVKQIAFFKLVLVAHRGKVSKLSCRCGGPEMNASLDLMPVLNRRFLKNFGKELK